MYTYNEGIKTGNGIATLLMGPILGLLYVVAMPFIAIATIVTLLGGKILSGVLSLGRNIVFFGWRPTEAYLSGKKKQKTDDK